MADPLSIIASITAVIGAADSVGKALLRIKLLHDSPKQLLALINEVSDFRIVLYSVEKQFCRPQDVKSNSDHLSHLSDMIGKAKVTLLQLDELIEYRFKRPDSTDGHLNVSRVEWLRAEVTVERLRQALRDVKQNIESQMGLMNSCVLILFFISLLDSLPHNKLLDDFLISKVSQDADIAS